LHGILLPPSGANYYAGNSPSVWSKNQGADQHADQREGAGLWGGWPQPQRPMGTNLVLDVHRIPYPQVIRGGARMPILYAFEHAPARFKLRASAREYAVNRKLRTISPVCCVP